MLHYVYFLAKIGADTAENEQHFAEFLPIGRLRCRIGPLLIPHRQRSAFVVRVNSWVSLLAYVSVSLRSD